MRKTAIALLACFVAAPAMATNLLSDSFTYPDGGLVPNGGWANFSGAATDIQVVSGRAVGVPLNANDDHVFFALQPTTSTTYACITVRIPAIATAPKPNYFFALKDGGTSAFVSRLFVLPITGGFTFGLSHSSTSATVGVVPWSAATLLYDHDYTIVINYDPVAKSSTMWVDPVNQASPSVSISNPAIAALGVTTLMLRQSATAATLPPSPAYVGTTDWNFSVDSVGAGTSFTDACTGTVAVMPANWSGVKALYR